ncbi:MAG TPA: tetratricopeptide repeat protein, partial [Candidatus Acidoferrum sp.]|nr:tetratricopeptide repeat protein [Candidatus Acidoferrum sp.]
GGSYHLLGQHEKGLADRTIAIRLNPSSAVAWTARGDAYFLLGRWDEALADLEQATRLDPANKETAQLKAVAKQHVDDTIAEAKANERVPETPNVTLPKPVETKPVEAAPVASPPEPAAPAAAAIPAPSPAPTPPAPPVEKGPASAAQFHALGRKFIQDEKFEEAITALSEAIKLDSNLATAFNARGYCYSRLRKYKEALADFDQAIKLNPGYGNAYTNRASARRAAGDKAGADADQAKARELLKLGK